MATYTINTDCDTKKMSDCESDSEDIDQENIEMCLQERRRDEDTSRFSFWMSEHQLPLPIEHWHDSTRKLTSVVSTQHGGTGHISIPKHRWDLFMEAAEYYVNIYEGKFSSVLAEIILHYK